MSNTLKSLAEELSLADLILAVESDVTAGRFYIAANTTGYLYAWLSNYPPVVALQDALFNHTLGIDYLAQHTLMLFSQPGKPLYRLKTEPAIVCYAYVLYHFRDRDSARNALNQMYRYVGPQHGALERLIDNCYQQALTQTGYVEEKFIPINTRSVTMGTLTQTNTGDPFAIGSTDPTSFDVDGYGMAA